MKENITLVAQKYVQKASGLKYFSIWVRNYHFLKNYVTSEGSVTHNVLYYQQLSIARYHLSFYANNYFEYLPIVSSAFKKQWLKWALSQTNLYL